MISFLYLPVNGWYDRPRGDNTVLEIAEQQIQKRGRILSVDRLDPRHSALVVIDVQNDFCSPDGVVARSGKDVSGALEMIPRLIELIDGARSNDVPVVLVRTTHSDDSTTDSWRFRTGKKESTPNCVPGSWGADFFQIIPHPNDHVVTKHRYSAFNSAEFVNVISRLNRPSLVFCGVATNICVETSVRDATCADYYATLVSDCSGAYSKELHAATIKNVQNNFGLVVTVRDLLGAWQKVGSAH